MPNLHDIEKRIKSVSSTKQITRTMEMVAGAKVKYATERIQTSAPYADSMTEMLQGVAARVQASENPLLEKRESVKRVLCVAVVSDRGLAGGFNSNVLRTVEKTIRAKKAQGVEVDVIACGKKAGGFFKFRGVTPVLDFKDLSADPTFEEASEIADYAVKAYEEAPSTRSFWCTTTARTRPSRCSVRKSFCRSIPRLSLLRLPRKPPRMPKSPRALSSSPNPPMCSRVFCPLTCARRSTMR